MNNNHVPLPPSLYCTPSPPHQAVHSLSSFHFNPTQSVYSARLPRAHNDAKYRNYPNYPSSDQERYRRQHPHQHLVMEHDFAASQTAHALAAKHKHRNNSNNSAKSCQSKSSSKSNASNHSLPILNKGKYQSASSPSVLDINHNAMLHHNGNGNQAHTASANAHAIEIEFEYDTDEHNEGGHVSENNIYQVLGRNSSFRKSLQRNYDVYRVKHSKQSANRQTPPPHHHHHQQQHNRDHHQHEHQPAHHNSNKQSSNHKHSAHSKSNHSNHKRKKCKNKSKRKKSAERSSKAAQDGNMENAVVIVINEKSKQPASRADNIAKRKSLETAQIKKSRQVAAAVPAAKRCKSKSVKYCKRTKSAKSAGAMPSKSVRLDKSSRSLDGASAPSISHDIRDDDKLSDALLENMIQMQQEMLCHFNRSRADGCSNPTNPYQTDHCYSDSMYNDDDDDDVEEEENDGKRCIHIHKSDKNTPAETDVLKTPQFRSAHQEDKRIMSPKSNAFACYAHEHVDNSASLQVANMKHASRAPQQYQYEQEEKQMKSMDISEMNFDVILEEQPVTHDRVASYASTLNGHLQHYYEEEELDIFQLQSKASSAAEEAHRDYKHHHHVIPRKETDDDMLDLNDSESDAYEEHCNQHNEEEKCETFQRCKLPTKRASKKCKAKMYASPVMPPIVEDKQTLVGTVHATHTGGRQDDDDDDTTSVGISEMSIHNHQGSVPITPITPLTPMTPGIESIPDTKKRLIINGLDYAESMESVEMPASGNLNNSCRASSIFPKGLMSYHEEYAHHNHYPHGRVHNKTRSKSLSLSPRAMAHFDEYVLNEHHENIMNKKAEALIIDTTFVHDFRHSSDTNMHAKNTRKKQKQQERDEQHRHESQQEEEQAYLHDDDDDDVDDENEEDEEEEKLDFVDKTVPFRRSATYSVSSHRSAYPLRRSVEMNAPHRQSSGFELSNSTKFKRIQSVGSNIHQNALKPATEMKPSSSSTSPIKLSLDIGINVLKTKKKPKNCKHDSSKKKKRTKKEKKAKERKHKKEKKEKHKKEKREKREKRETKQCKHSLSVEQRAKQKEWNDTSVPFGIPSARKSLPQYFPFHLTQDLNQAFVPSDSYKKHSFCVSSLYSKNRKKASSRLLYPQIPPPPTSASTASRGHHQIGDII